MKLLVSGATRDVATYPDCGILVTPQGGNSVRKITRSGRVWAADNSAFGAWDQRKFQRMIAKLAYADRSRFLWVACPDVVCDAPATLAKWAEWFPVLSRLKLAVAFVAQDGIEETPDVIPWAEMGALFIGGSTAWKLGPEAARLAKRAKSLGKLVHMGRVNSETRIKHCLEIGVDTVDGTGFSMFPKLIASGLAWIDKHTNTQIQSSVFVSRPNLVGLARCESRYSTAIAAALPPEPEAT